MKCLLLTLDYPPNRSGGMANYFLGMSQNFPAGSMIVLTGAGDGTEADRACTVYRAPVRSGAVAFVPIWVWYCLRIIRREGITLILCGNASPFKYVASICRLFTGVPYGIHFFGNDLLRLGRRMDKSARAQATARRTAGRAVALVTCSEFTAEEAVRILTYPRERIVVTYPGIGASFADRQVEPPNLQAGEPLRIISIGRLTARKGFDRVVESLAVLARQGRAATYTLVGKGEQRFLRELAERCGVANRVTFRGYVSSTEELIEAILDAHVLAMPSRIEAGGIDVEGFGTVFVEAGALKRPSLASRTGGVPEAVVHMKTGLLVDDPDSAEQIAEALGQFIEHPALLTQMGETAYRRAHECFRLEGICQRLYDELSRTALGNGSPVRRDSVHEGD